jgi:hypothetical protein
MIETDSKKLKEAEWLRQHTLTKDQTKQLILNKLKRAEEMHLALSKREMFVQKHR